MNTSTSIAFDILVLIFSSIGFLTSAGILFLIIYHRRQNPINANMLLIANTYISIIFICLLLLDMYIYNLYGDLHSNISFDNRWCYARAYLLYVGFASVYHSYLLQALFRFFRIVLYKRKQLQTLRFISRLVLLQWLIDFIYVIPIFLLHLFQYISGYYYCEIPFNNLPRLIYPSYFVYFLPILIIEMIYFYILYYMKKTKGQSTSQNRQANQRDLVVLRRTIILVAILLIVCLPSVVLYVQYWFSGYLYPAFNHLQHSTYVFSLSILPAISMILTPQLRELVTARWRQNRRIQPVTIVQWNRNNQNIA